MTRLESLVEQKKRAMASYNYVEVVRLDKLIKEATEDVSLNKITDTLDDGQKHTLVCSMNRVFIYAKLLGVSADSFISTLKEVDNIRSVAIVDQSRAALHHLNKITGLLEDNPNMKDDFDKLINDITLAVNNFIYRHEAANLKK